MASLTAFLTKRPYSVVHIDAEWDGCLKALRNKVLDVERQLEGSVSFGYLDADSEQEYVRNINLRNVPGVAYYVGVKLFGVVIGMQQDVEGNILRMMKGESLTR